MSAVSLAVPSFPTFVRDRLAEHLDGLGHHVTDADERDGFPCLTVESDDGALFEDVAVLVDGRTMSMVDGWTEVRLRGFAWHAEPTDTGKVHGPARLFPTWAEKLVGLSHLEYDRTIAPAHLRRTV